MPESRVAPIPTQVRERRPADGVELVVGDQPCFVPSQETTDTARDLRRGQRRIPEAELGQIAAQPLHVLEPAGYLILVLAQQQSIRSNDHCRGRRQWLGVLQLAVDIEANKPDGCLTLDGVLVPLTVVQIDTGQGAEVVTPGKKPPART